VRFIEITHGSWDQHSDHRRDLTANCATNDAPIAALLDDLDECGLLEDTLVIWGGGGDRASHRVRTRIKPAISIAPSAFGWLAA
jgi:arylsulfatase A-like enzyme